MKYPNIKKHRLTHEMIAEALGYSGVKAFRNSSAHQRIMNGIDSILEVVEDLRIESVKSAVVEFELAEFKELKDSVCELLDKYKVELEKLSYASDS